MSKLREIINSILSLFGLKLVFLSDYNLIKKQINFGNEQIDFIKNSIKRIDNEFATYEDYKKELLESKTKLRPMEDISNSEIHPEYILALKSILGDRDLTIFDIGAHKGETLKTFNECFLNSQIYSFEPFKGAFQFLAKESEKIPNSKAFNIGFSDFNGKKEFYNYVDPSNPNISALNSLFNLKDEKFIPTVTKKEVVECEFQTLDNFTEKNKIEYIDLLKIDVQGAEYQVFQGGAKLLKDKRINTIFMEVMIVEFYENQKDFIFYLSYFKQQGYELKGIYNLISDSSNQTLYFDAVFSAN